MVAGGSTHSIAAAVHALRRESPPREPRTRSESFRPTYAADMAPLFSDSGRSSARRRSKSVSRLRPSPLRASADVARTSSSPKAAARFAELRLGRALDMPLDPIAEERESISRADDDRGAASGTVADESSAVDLLASLDSLSL